MLGIGASSDTGPTVGSLARTPWATPLLPYSATLATTGWGRVRVEGIDSHLRRERDGSDQVVVRACVYLGTLLPADVRVDLLTGTREPGAAARDVGCRLWTTHSYENGVFVFEASVPASTMERAAGFGVRVTPFRARDEAPALPPVLQWVEPPHHAWWGAPTADTYSREP